MRFYKEVWGIIWEFNSISEFIWFTAGRILGVIIFILLMLMIAKCDAIGGGEAETVSDYEPIPASVYQY